jgi:lysophospholipase L1-like esterase
MVSLKRSLKNILIFGDSNSWGYVDEDNGKRYESRWPIIFENNLNKENIDCKIIEDALPGRTTNIDDGKDGEHLNGATTIKSTLLSNSPIDIVIILLGTNDLKARFDREPQDVANGVLDLISIAYNTNSGEGTWHDEKKSEVVILVPPILGKLSINENWINYKEWIGAFEKSKKLNGFYKDMCKEKKIEFIDTNEFIVSSEKDPIHWSKKTHKDFGEILAKIFAKKIKL